MTRTVARAGFLVAVAVLSASCQVRTEVGLDVREDGSGTVVVSVALDDDAMSQLPGIGDQLRLDDLRATGWKISGPTREKERGLTRWKVTKRFSRPEDAGRVLAEISGEKGPFRAFQLERHRSFARTRFAFQGTVDLSGGVESFADQELAQALDGKPLGDDPAAIEARIGETLDRVFRFRVTVRLPGGMTSSNATTEASNGAVWEPSLSEGGPITLHAASQSWRTRTLILAAVGIAALLALMVIGTVRFIRARRAA